MSAEPASTRTTAARAALPPFLVAKVLTLLVPLLYVLVYLGPTQGAGLRNLRDAYWHWDTFHYLNIALHGYPDHFDFPYAFLPGYPLLLRTAMAVIPDPIVAGLLLSAGFEFLALYYLARLVMLERDERSARFATWALVLYPAAFFLSGVYAESPLLAGGAAALYYARRGVFGRAAAAAAFACAMKVLGLLLVVPLLIEYRNRHGLRLRWTLAAIACVPLPLLLYAAYTWLRIGDPFAYSHAQALPMFSRLHVAPPWEGLVTDIGATLQGSAQSRLIYAGELLWAGLGVLGVVWAWFRPRFARSLAAYCGVLMLLMLCFSFWRSLGRYELTLFPLLIPVSDLLVDRTWLRRGLLLASAAGMGYGTYTFLNGGWWG
jgi:hypothetical protein